LAYHGACTAAAIRIERDLDNWRQAELRSIDRELVRLAKAAESLGYWVTRAGLVVLLVIGPLGMLVKYRALSRLGALSASMLRLARNETDVIVPFTAAADEIGEFARAIEVFKTN